MTNITDAVILQEGIISNFYLNGGYNIDIKKLNASDDTIMSIATKKACDKGGKIQDFIDEYLKIESALKEEKRASGITTLENLENIKKLKNISKLPYNKKYGGNGASMRTSIIGLYYYKENQIDELIEKSIESSRITHNYTMGFLGGLVSAVFTSYAARNIHPLKWCQLILELEDSKKIDQYMKNTNIYQNYLNDKESFWINWRKYKERRLKYFLEEKKPKQFEFSQNRYIELLNYTPEVNLKYKKTMVFEGNITVDNIINLEGEFNKFGASGIGSTIVSYDCLLSSIIYDKYPINLKKKVVYNWENLIYFSCLNFGDSDTIGAIVGSWYGASNELNTKSKKFIDLLEFKNEFINLYLIKNIFK